MAFDERFALLQESGQVSPAAVEAAREILAGIETFLGRPLDEESDAMVATHLVMAMERLAQGEPIAELAEEIVDEVRSCRVEWALASALLGSAADRFGRTAPLAEVVYLTAHLRSLKGEPE